VRKQKEKREEQRDGTTLVMGFPGKDTGKCTLVYFKAAVWNECQVQATGLRLEWIIIAVNLDIVLKKPLTNLVIVRRSNRGRYCL
jgi:hypothetical protein